MALAFEVYRQRTVDVRRDQNGARNAGGYRERIIINAKKRLFNGIRKWQRAYTLARTNLWKTLRNCDKRQKTMVVRAWKMEVDAQV